MRFVRYQYKAEPAQFGWILEDRVGPVEGTPFGDFRRHELERDLDEVRLLAPVLPSKVLCIGRNYVAHALEQNAEVPEVPLLFLKPPLPSSVQARPSSSPSIPASRA